MKYISITFDDGREDNYSVAYPVMERYHMKGTVFVTTGFVDGTWEEYHVLDSPRRALSVEEIRELAENGWEIGLHGDRHTTEVRDLIRAYDKLNGWIHDKKPAVYGFSVPNSTASDEEIDSIRAMKDRILYIRKGRRKANTGIIRKVLYVLSYFGGMQWAYNQYNKDNICSAADSNRTLYSVVVKTKDKPEMILKLLDTIPDETGIILMLHSVLPAEECKASRSPWIWEEEKLNTLCRLLSEGKDRIRVVTARELVNRAGQKSPH